MASSDAAVEHTTSAALEEKAKLQRHFGRFDMFFFLICTLVGLDTIGAVASNGAQGFTWLMFLGLVFFIPYAFLTAELGCGVHRGGRPVHLDEARARPPDQRRERDHLLDLEPDLARRHAHDHRRGGVQRVLPQPRQRRVHLRAGLHLVLGVGRDPVVRRRQVDPDPRRMGADDRARVLLDHGRDLCDQARRARRLGRQLQADLHRLHRARADPVLQLRRLRAAERRGRRDEEPAARRAVHRDPLGDRGRSCSTASRS